MPVANAEVARLLREVADLLEIQEANPFRIRAYRNAARTVNQQGPAFAERAARGEELGKLFGVGADLDAKIHEIARTGSCELLQQLRRTVPRGTASLLRIPGLGPKRVRALSGTARHPHARAVAGGRASRLALIDDVIAEAIAARQVPGAVVVVGRRGGVAFQKAYGDRAQSPAREAMTLDTVFDAASVTKVVTTTSVMKLVEDGRIRLTDRVAAYIPEFAKYGKGDITIRHLLTHTSGLRPDVDLTFAWSGYDEGIRLACEEVALAVPDAQFVYSDINFFVLGDIVRRVSGLALDREVPHPNGQTLS